MEKLKENVSHMKIKEPGSAITHFIAMIMALFAATPLIIKGIVSTGYDTCYIFVYIYRNYDSFICGKHNLSYS